jgi:hypothetical protein
MKTVLVAPILVSMLIAPCHAGELDNLGPSTQFYVRVPIGAAAPKERVLSYGLAIRGRQEHQVFTLDSRTLDALSQAYDGGLMAGLELKWLLIGGAAVVGAVAVAKAGGGGSSSGPTKQGTPPPAQPDRQSTQNTPPPTQGTQPTPTDPCVCPSAKAFYF